MSIDPRDGARFALPEPHEPGTLAFVTDLRGLSFAETGDTVRIEVCRDGCWNHPVFGRIEVTPAVRESFARNFRENVRRVGDLPLDYDHARGPASGWIVGLDSRHGEAGRPGRLVAEVRLTERARQQVRGGEYRFFSPEWHPDWHDPETGRRHGPTLFGGGLTNRPFFRGLAAIQCSETTTGDPPLPPIVAAGAPSKEDQMSERSPEATLPALPEGLAAGPAAVPDPGAHRLEERIAAVEAENAAFRASEERRAITETLAGLTFADGRSRLAPASRASLSEALLRLPAAQRQPVIEALRALRFTELGERGFAAAVAEEDDAALTAAEERACRDLSARNGLRFEEVRDQFREVKKQRQHTR